MMIEPFNGFKSSAGRIHSGEYDAWKDEFGIWLKTHGVSNEGIVAQIVKAVDDGQPETLTGLRAIIDGMTRCAPAVAIDAEEPQDDTAPAAKALPYDPEAACNPPKAIVRRGTNLLACEDECKCNHLWGTCTSTAECEQ